MEELLALAAKMGIPEETIMKIMSSVKDGAGAIGSGDMPSPEDQASLAGSFEPAARSRMNADRRRDVPRDPEGHPTVGAYDPRPPMQQTEESPLAGPISRGIGRGVDEIGRGISEADQNYGGYGKKAVDIAKMTKEQAAAYLSKMRELDFSRGR